MNGYISIRVILDDLLDHPMLRTLSFERAVNHTVHLMRITGCPRMFLEKTAVLEVEEYRAVLPCDFYEMIQIRTAGECGGHRHGVFRKATDSFHQSEDHHRPADLTYRIQGGYIYTSVREGKIEIAYRALAVDEEGYPLIPDNSPFIRALEAYIKKCHFTVLFDMGKIPQNVLVNAEQEYAFYIGQAQSDLIRSDLDQMQAITNMWNTLVPRVREHEKTFRDEGTREYIRLQ